jgi:putative MATE family efflux protein
MSEQKTMINDLTKGNVTKQLLVFAAPFMLSNLLQTAYSLVDMIVIGQFVGSAGLSAVSIGSELMMLFTFIAMGFSTAGQIMISQFIGKDDRGSIKSTIGTMFSFIQALSIVITFIGLVLANWLLVVMNTPEEAYTQAYQYSIVCYIGMFFIFGYNTVSAILRGMGDSKRPFVFIAIAAVTNLILDLVFVAGFGLGAMGAALATVIGQALSFVISIIYLYRRRDAFGFDFKLASFKIDKTKLMPMLKLGFPMALQNMALSFSMLFVNSYINSYGLVASTVTGIGNKLRSLMSIVSISLSTAGSSMIGQNIAAEKYDRVKKIVRVSLICCFIFATFLSVIMELFPKQIFSIFDTDAEVLEWAPAYMHVAVVTFFSFVFMTPFNAVINGLGYATLSFVIGMMDGVVARIGLSLLMGIAMDMGIIGFWYGNALAGYVSAILGAAYYFSGRWKTHKLLIDN